MIEGWRHLITSTSIGMDPARNGSQFGYGRIMTLVFTVYRTLIMSTVWTHPTTTLLWEDT